MFYKLNSHSSSARLNLYHQATVSAILVMLGKNVLGGLTHYLVCKSVAK